MSIYNSTVNPIYGEGVTRLTLTDEAGGGFFELSQSTDYESTKIRLQLDEIAAIYNHASRMMQDYDAETDKV